MNGHHRVHIDCSECAVHTHPHTHTQMMDILEPGCNGVLKDLDSVPTERLLQALQYTVETGGELYGYQDNGDNDIEDYEDWQEEEQYWREEL